MHALIKKSGGNAEDESIKNFLLNGELVKIEIPEDVSKVIDNNLISLKDAKNNHPDIKPHYYQMALGTVDKTIEKLIEELGIEEAVKADILSETSTYKRVPALVTKVRELESKKAASGKEDKAAIQKQIDDLHAQIRTEKQRADDAKVNFEQQLTNYKIQNKISSLFSNFKTVYDDLDPEIKMTTLQNILTKNLQDNGAEIKFDENGNLSLLKKDGTNYYGDNNQQVNPAQYVEMLMSRNKLLKSAPPAPPPGGGQQQPPAPPNGSGDKKTNFALKSLVADAMSSYGQPAQ